MSCIFCQIAQKTAPATIIYEDDEIIAFNDLYPVAPTHILFVPKRHIASIIEATEEDALLLGKLINAARKVAAERGLTGYKLSFNVGKDGGQVVFHIHLHLMGGWEV